jgi:hypothetical protein
MEPYFVGKLGYIPQFSARSYCNISCTERVIFFPAYSTIYLASPNKKIYRVQTQKINRCRTSHTHATHNTTLHTKTRRAAASLPPVALTCISMATSAMAPNHGAVAPHESVAGAWRWVCSCHGWFPWLGCRIKMHRKKERWTGPRP